MAITPPPRATRRIGRLFSALALLCVGSAALYIGYLFKKSPWTIQALTSLIAPRTPEQVFRGPLKQSLNLLIIGRDYDYSNKDQVIKSHARSDMLMMGHLDFAHHKIELLSFPRDTRASIPGHGVHKVNAAHAYGGPALTADTVKANFGIPTDKYIALDFQGFEEAIDLLGGVELNVDKKMDYDDKWGHLHIHLLPGLQRLNGPQAMGFVRFRHADSDLVRTRRQQALIAAFRAKLTQPAALARLPALLSTIDKHIDSDLSTEQKVVVARFLHDTPRDRMQMATLPSRERGNESVADWATATPLIQKIFGVSPPETLADSVTPAPAASRHHRRRHASTRVASRS